MPGKIDHTHILEARVDRAHLGPPVQQQKKKMVSDQVQVFKKDVFAHAQPAIYEIGLGLACADLKSSNSFKMLSKEII